MIPDLTRRALRAALTLFAPALGLTAATLALPANGPPPVAYQTGPGFNTDVALLDPATRVTINLTLHEARDSTPAWSPDGATVSFASNRGDGDMDLYRLAPRTRAVELVQDTAQEGSGLVWSPDGDHAAYLEGSGTYIDVMLLRPDGSRRPLTRNGIVSSQPVWSPDGSRVAFVNAHQNIPDVFVADVDGRTPRRLTRNAGASAPVWLPGGEQIAYSTRSAGTERIVWISDVEAGSRQQVFSAPGLLQIAWSPDASHIAYTTTTNGTYELFVAPFAPGLRATDLQPQQITLNQSVRAFAWSPDGDYIIISLTEANLTTPRTRLYHTLSGAFTADMIEPELYLYRLGWDAPHRLTYNVNPDTIPSFQP